MKSSAEELFANYLNGIATAAELSELDALLVSDPSAASRLAELGRLDSLLANRFSGKDRQQQADRLLALLVPPSTIVPSPVQVGASIPSAPFLPTTRKSPVLGFLAGVSRRVPGGEFTVGSLLLLVIVAAFWGLSQAILFPKLGGHDLAHDLSPLAPDKGRGAGGEGKFVATIRDEADAQWSPESRLTDAATSRGAAIAANQPLSITSGLIELELKQGTTLFIEGPADWKITGENSATLTHGKLVAKVPQQAIGFTLETPAAKIIDLGTEFGVEVGQNGNAEVHVLIGLVNLLAEPANGNTVPPRSLKAGQSLRIEPDGKQSAGDPATGEKLTRLAEGKQDSTTSDPGYEVLFHYRLGDDDKNAKAGEIAAEQIIGTGTLGATQPLTRVGEPKYARETPIADSKLALSLDGDKEAEGYLGKEFTDLPIDNCVLEAWVRPHSFEPQVVAYLGHPSLNGYGLILENGKWSGLHGSLESIAATEKPRMNEWTHLAWVRERGHIQLFIDGAPSGPEAITSCKPPEATVRIGHAPGNVPQTFDGEIDEVRLIKLTTFFRPNMFLKRQE